MPKAPVHLETARLALSPPELADAALIFARYASDPDVTRLVGWPRHQSVTDTEAFVRLSLEEWERWPAGPYLIRLRDNGQLLGGTGLAFETVASATTGYVLARDAWGRGYATEALTAMIDLARDLRLGELAAYCHADHAVSRRVLEKCGFARDAGWTGGAAFPNLGDPEPHPSVRYQLRLEAS